MARILPGSLGSTFSGVERARELRAGAVDYAKAPETPHGFDALAKTLNHPLTGMATAGISRIADEMAYASEVDAEKKRMEQAKADYETRQAEASNASEYLQSLEGKMGGIPEAAIQAAGMGPQPQAPAFSLGQIGTAPSDPGTPTQLGHGAAIGGMAQPTEGGWGDYTYSQIREMMAELERMKGEEAARMQAVGPAPEARFVPKTVAEFQAAISAERDPERRMALLRASSRATDVQPGSLGQAIKGTAGQKAQAAVRGSDVKAQEFRHKQAKDINEADRKQGEFELDQMWKQAKLDISRFSEESKHAKRKVDIKHTNLKMKKLERRLRAIGRRRGVPDHIKALLQKHGGFSKAATSNDFYDELAQVASGKEFKHWQGVMIRQVKDTMGKDVAIPLAATAQLGVDKLEMTRAVDELADAKSKEAQALASLDDMGGMVAQATDRPSDGGWFSDAKGMPAEWYEDKGVRADLMASDKKAVVELFRVRSGEAREARARRVAAEGRAKTAAKAFEGALKGVSRITGREVVPPQQSEQDFVGPPAPALQPATDQWKLVGVR